MADQDAANKPKPPITAEGVKRLIAKLDEDLAKVKASNASATLKAETATLVQILNVTLNSVITLDPNSVGGWVLQMSDQFTRLTANIQTALSLDASEIGACSYTNPDGCIKTTREQCELLGGSFDPGIDCPIS